MITRILSPLGYIYGIGHMISQNMPCSPLRLPVPVICVGNLTAGGSGKTPVVKALLKIIQDRKLAQTPCILSRGYGGRLPGPTLVNPGKHSCEDVGDEPLMLARLAPVIISRDRREGAALAQDHGFDLIIMDDGLQNRGIQKTLTLTVIDSRMAFGNGRLLPAGPLREPLESGLKKSDAFVLIGKDLNNILSVLPVDKPVLRSRLHIAEDWKAPKGPCIAFCGLGHPEKFKMTILEKNIVLAGWHTFPDHHVFTIDELRKLDREALASGARLLTTEKDAIRIPATFTFKSPLDIMPVHIRWENENDILTLLQDKVKKTAGAS